MKPHRQSYVPHSGHPVAAFCLRVLAAAFLLCGQAAAGDTAAPEIRLLTWNVENLFDTADDPKNEGDDSFTPQGWRRWNDDIYRIKQRHLAQVLAASAADIVCLQEVENRTVLDELVTAIQTVGGQHYPYIIHRDGPDHRGIDVAVLSRFKPNRRDWILPVPEQREILQLDFSLHGHAWTLFVNHWKSRWDGTEATAPLRYKQARALRERIDAMLAESEQAAVVVAGDFNDAPDSASLTDGLRVQPAASPDTPAGKGPGTALINLHAGLPLAERGTIYYAKGKVWNAFDAMYVTPVMLTTGAPAGGGWRIKPNSYQVYRKRALLTDSGTPLSFRRYKNRKTNRWEYRQGYSDHLPVCVTLELR